MEIATRERGERRVFRADLDLELTDDLVGELVGVVPGEHRPTPQLAVRPHHRILGDRKFWGEPDTETILGDVGEAGPEAPLRRRRSDVMLHDRDRAGFDRLEAGDGVGESPLTVAGDAGDTDDLT